MNAYYRINTKINNLKEIDIKNCILLFYYFFDDMINMKNIAPNKIKVDEKSHKNIFKYYINNRTTNSVKSLYLIIIKLNGHIKETKGNKQLLLMKAKTHGKKMKNYGM